MKTLLFVLKAFATTAVATPLACQCGYYASEFENLNTTTHTLTQKYTIDQQWLDTHLLDKSNIPLDKFSNFRKIANIGNITNDDASYWKTNDKNGAPYIRFGGGLFFDHPWDFTHAPASLTPQDKDTLKKSTFGTYGFTSIKNTQKNPVEALDNNTVMPNDYYASESDGRLNHTKSHLPPAPYTVEDWNQNINFDFTKTKTPEQYINLQNQLSNGSDLDLTPTYLQKTSIAQANKSQMKKTFSILFNDELSYWYWRTWGSHYDNYTFANQMEGKYNTIDNALTKGGYINTPKLNLSLSYNQLVSQTHAIPWWAKAAKFFGNLAVDTVTADVPELGSFANAVLDFFLPNSYKTYQSQLNLLNYYSIALDDGFWSNLFNQYLGTPTSKTGLINQFINQYHELPSSVNLNDFDFYIPYSEINIQSQFTWRTTSYVPDGGTDISNKSTSNINLSNLQLKMGASFTLTRQDPDLANFLAALGTLPKSDLSFYTMDFHKSSDGNYYSQNSYNDGFIRDSIGSSLPGYKAFAVGLTFKGQMVAGQTRNIEVYYNKIDQHITIPITLTTW